jgi:hypothetical protein
MMKRHLVYLVLALIAASPAHAAIQTITGTNFDLVYDDTKLGLFGTPSLAGNNIFFTPNNFKAESLNGAGIVSNNSTISGMQLVAKNSFQFGSIDLTEFGDYLMRGSESFVSVNGQLRAFDGANFSATNTSASLIVSSSTPLNTIDGFNHDWLTTASITNATASNSGLTGWLSNASVVNITVENLLTAYTEAGPGPEQAFIEKKAIGVGLVVTSAVPEPGVWSSLSAGLFLLGMMASRRNKKI